MPNVASSIEMKSFVFENFVVGTVDVDDLLINYCKAFYSRVSMIIELFLSIIKNFLSYIEYFFNSSYKLLVLIYFSSF